ncbi:MAG TPA: DUF885 domain-containing protein [Mucilaginibacter sp.]|jgi:uncharacterized protein (DUF885 family)|nr:DUF885 domain-containing protein [Mucilaginibacter sp.]
MKTIFLSLGIALITFSAPGQQRKFDDFSVEFVKGYKALNLPQLELSYASGFKHIQSADSVQKQMDFFGKIKGRLASYKENELAASQKIDYELIKYETSLSLERIALEQRCLKEKPAQISAGGIITVPNGKAWYAYLLKRWVGDDVTPDQIYQFGLGEVKRVQRHIEDVRKRTGLSEDEFYKHLNDASFFTSDSEEVQHAFEHTKSVVYANLHKLFSDTAIPPLKIERGESKQLAQTPGYYNDSTFYYNLFDKPYCKRQYDWLFIHEGVPGHHYQSSIAAKTKILDVQQLFFYYGFAEGWGAYAEELGKQLGVYQTPYDELGKWEWDIVRSVRVPLDVGLNYYGWTDEQALAFWKKNIRGQDDIAMREIARIRRWPAQVVTYKYGALQIMHWKEELQKNQGRNFSIRNFHDRVLDHGNLPLFMVKENVFGNT